MGYVPLPLLWTREYQLHAADLRASFESQLSEKNGLTVREAEPPKE